MGEQDPVNYVDSLGGYSVGDKVVHSNSLDVTEIAKMWVQDGENKFFGYRPGDRTRTLPAGLSYQAKNVSDIKRKATQEEWDLASAGFLGVIDKVERGTMDQTYVNMPDGPVKRMYMLAFNERFNPFILKLGGRRKSKKVIRKSRKTRKTNKKRK